MSLILFCFIDESGQPYQLDEGPYVLTAITVKPDHLRSSEDKVRRFIVKWSEQLGFSIDEIHARQIVQGEQNWRSVSKSVRQQVLSEFALLVSSLPIVINSVAVVKEVGAKIHNWQGIRQRVLVTLLERVILTPRYPPDVLIIAFDSAAAKQDYTVKCELEEAIGRTLVRHNTRLFTSFEDSKKSPLIQVADFAGYLIRNILVNRYKVQGINLEEPFLKIEPKIRRCPRHKHLLGMRPQNMEDRKIVSGGEDAPAVRPQRRGLPAGVSPAPPLRGLRGAWGDTPILQVLLH